MLVISRKPGEELKIGDSVRVSVISVNGDKVTIGIDAPRDIPVLRGELVDTIESNQESSAQLPGAEARLGLAALLKESDGE
ncbi:MAG: carbon storage regulator [Clostridiales Family XIII bacterium]|jgi:carbon storage regulator|nr:carbon storage regulator [Clostridiales Family XIII bacterium]